MSTPEHVEAFTELLAADGIDLTFGETTFQALLSRTGNEAQDFDLAPGDVQQVTISCFKSALPNLPGTGNYFTDAEGGRYRITARRPNPGRPVAKFVCEYSENDE